MGRLVCHQTTVAAKEPSNAQNALQRHSGTAGPVCFGFWVLGRIDRSRNNLSDVSDCSAALLLCCGIFVTEVKSLISRFTAFGSLIYCVLEMEATQFIFISNKQLFPLSSQWGLIKTLWTTIFFSNLNDWLNVMFNSSNGGDDDHLYDFNTKWETCSMLFIKNTRSSFVLLEL